MLSLYGPRRPSHKQYSDSVQEPSLTILTPKTSRQDFLQTYYRTFLGSKTALNCVLPAPEESPNAADLSQPGHLASQQDGVEESGMEVDVTEEVGGEEGAGMAGVQDNRQIVLWAPKEVVQAVPPHWNTVLELFPQHATVASPSTQVEHPSTATDDTTRSSPNELVRADRHLDNETQACQQVEARKKQPEIVVEDITPVEDFPSRQHAIEYSPAAAHDDAVVASSNDGPHSPSPDTQVMPVPEEHMPAGHIQDEQPIPSPEPGHLDPAPDPNVVPYFELDSSPPPSRPATPFREIPTSDVFTSSPVGPGTPPAHLDQWRVGKEPGHAGLRTKRLLNSDDIEIDDIATRLKRPFRSPSRTPQPPSSPSPVRPAASPLIPAKRPSTSSSPLPKKVCKPFTPLRARPSTTRRKDADLIAALEARVRTLKQAVRYQAPNEDERLEGLIATWREAGREISDRLFSLVPRPEPSSSHSSWDGWTETTPLSREELDYLLDAPTDKDGNPVDADGDVLPMFREDGDLMSELGLSAGKGPGWNDGESSREGLVLKTNEWDTPAMLLAFGVDPDLLGWDKEAGDWAEVEAIWSAE